MQTIDPTVLLALVSEHSRPRIAVRERVSGALVHAMAGWSHGERLLLERGGVPDAVRVVEVDGFEVLVGCHGSLAHDPGHVQTRFDALTTRERQVLVRVVRGDLNKQIAYELGICLGTVKAHRCRMMRKMGADCLVELVRMVDSLGPMRVAAA